MLEIIGIPFSDIENDAELPVLLKEYGEECGIEGLPTPQARFESYRALQNSGSMNIIAAYYDKKLIGFVSILTPVMPHYSIKLCVLESIFVAKDKRNTGAGIRLIKAAEQFSANAGSPGLLISAPYGGDLAELLPKMEYVETNRVFFKKLSNV